MKTVKKLLVAVFALAVITTAALPKEVKAEDMIINFHVQDNQAGSWDRSSYTWDGTSHGSLDIKLCNDISAEVEYIRGIVDKNGKAIFSSKSTVSGGQSTHLFLDYGDSFHDWLISTKECENVPDSLEVAVDYQFTGDCQVVLTIKFTNVELPEDPAPTPSPSSSSSGSEEKVFIDYDTYKSELPSHTVLATLNKNYSNDYKMDMKAHAPSAATAANQSLLADAFAKSYNKTKNIIWSWDIFAKRDLTLSENGGRYEININTKVTGQAGTVYMECYSPEDKAYTLVGTMDDKGVATFDNFILRPATSVTIFTLK